MDPNGKEQSFRAETFTGHQNREESEANTVQEMTLSVEHIRLRAEAAFARFEQGDGLEYINEAIALGRRALNLCPSESQLALLIQLTRHLWNRFNQLEEIADLEEGVVLSRVALDLCPPEHPNRRLVSGAGAAYLFARYSQLGDMVDLNEAIILGRQALNFCPPGHPDYSSSLNSLANCLADRYDVLGEIIDLNEAIILARHALELCPPGHPQRSRPLSSLASYLSDRYNVQGEITDLNESIVLSRQSLNLRPPGHPDRPSSLNNVASCLANRYSALGEMTDLNEAIILGRQALELCLPGHSDRTWLLNSVANCLATRYKVLGEMTDLNEAIILGRQSLELRPPGHPYRSWSLNNLATYLANRYNVLWEMTDLDEAIILGRQALELRLPTNPYRSSSLNNLTVYLAHRYEVLGEMTDLSEAIIFGRQALELCPPGHPNRLFPLDNVANRLTTRYEVLQEMSDLNEAIILGREALDLCPLRHANRSHLLNTLAHNLLTRFTLSDDAKDREDLFSAYAQLASFSQIMSLNDLPVAKQWIDSAELFHHPTLLLAYETSLRLLIQHLSILPSLPHHVHTYKHLASSLATDAFSACLRNHNQKKAIEMLEQGRGLFWSQIARLRSPLEDVITSGPEGVALADEFARIASEIQNAIQSSHHQDQHHKLCDLNINLLSIITKIRTLPGLAHFLLPSPFSDLQQAASGGPVVVVNASQYTCDALIVFVGDDSLHVPLQITKHRVQALSSQLRSLTSHAKWEDVRSGFGRFLRDLWDEVVSPIVDILRATVPIGSRIWWCPTSEFSFLPLHAAGPYRRGQQNLSHLYISSYTPTLNALIRARRGDTSRKPLSSQNRFLVVGQSHADGDSELLSVGTELDIVTEHMKYPATLTRLEGPESSISRVSEEIRKSEWVHFACHGIPNEGKPFESGFALHDGRLTIERIMGYQLKHSQFAYLSACHTTVGDKENPDEVIHLASAMQFAGFRSVIGTMWAVDDEQTNKIVSMFYRHMVDGSGELDYTRAAFALNQTMKILPGISLDQRILYVHIGA